MNTAHATLLVTMLVCSACAGTDSPGAEDPGNEAVTQTPGVRGARADESFEGSAAVWDAARARGVTFRAVGQEPGWLVEVYPQQKVHVVADYGEIRFDAPWAEPVRADDGTLTYTTSTAEHTVRIAVTDVPCSDTMSGEEFPQAVVLALDGRVLYGCGRPLD